MVTSNNIHYVAGLLEGEGSFGFYGCPVIQLHMTDKDIVGKIRDIIAPDVDIRMQEKVKYNENSKPIYILHISGTIAIQWMMTLYSLMGKRRKEKIKEVIGKWKGMPNRMNNERCSRGHLMDDRNTYINMNSKGHLIRYCKACKNRKRRFRNVARKAVGLPTQ